MGPVTSLTSSSVSSPYINRNQRTQESALKKTASGSTINSAADNPAGLAVASQLFSDIGTLKQSATNSLQATSVLQTADGGLEQAGNVLTRMKELATQANSGSLDSNARNSINTEYQNLVGELNGLTQSTSFNGTKLLDGSYNRSFQTGTDGSDLTNTDLSAVNTDPSALGLTAAYGANPGALLSQSSAQSAASEIDTALGNISSYRSQVGANLSQFTTVNDNINSAADDLSAAASAIADNDIAQSQIDFNNSKLLNDTSIAAEAQANKMKASLLKLVR